MCVVVIAGLGIVCVVVIGPGLGIVCVVVIGQWLLAKAFRGELTGEWRNQNKDLICSENSAQALLDQIKTEQAKRKLKKKIRRKNST